jgi:hypothetical protein
MPEGARRRGAALAVAALSSLLVAAATRGLAVEELGDGRYRISIQLRTGAEPLEHAQAQIRLMERADRLCASQGGAVSDGAIVLGAPARGWFAVSEVYRCRMPAAQPAAGHDADAQPGSSLQ